LFQLSIAHIDCDSFYASVEKRDRSSLRPHPVIIGGGRRGVVAAACYVSRRYGVRSAMPMFKARAACPHAVTIRPNMAKYQAVGSEIRGMMGRLTTAIEPVSIDEAYLDCRNLQTGEPPALALARLAREIERQLGVTISVGLGPNKFLAKIASDLDKPRGFAAIGEGEAATFLRRQPVGLIHGVGQAMRKRLASDGVERIGQLRTFPPEVLNRRYGSFGERLAHYARGLDRRNVKAARRVKSVSGETTFEDPIRDPAELAHRLSLLVQRIAQRLTERDHVGTTVVLKLKTADFKTLTRSHTLTEPTADVATIEHWGWSLLAPETDGRAFRLIGIGLANIAAAVPKSAPDLLTLAAEPPAGRIPPLDTRLRLYSG